MSIVEMCYEVSSRKVNAQSVINWTVIDHLSCRVHSVLEKSLKMLEFGIKTSWPLKVLETD